MGELPSGAVLESEKPTSGEFQVLTEHDQKLLEESGRNLIEQFLKDYPDKLPDAIIFPDTAARPLYYLVRPVLEKVFQERNVPKPAAFFFAPVRSDALLRVRKVEKMSGVIRKIAESPITTYTEAKKEADSFRDIFKERADQIRADLANKGVDKPGIIIFDDFITGNATASSEIQRAFGEASPTYALLSNETGGDTFKKQGLPVVVGLWEQENIHFDYSNFEGKVSGGEIGVEKGHWEGKPWVAVAEESNIAQVRGLREDMEKIGRKIAKDLV